MHQFHILKGRAITYIRVLFSLKYIHKYFAYFTFYLYCKILAYIPTHTQTWIDVMEMFRLNTYLCRYVPTSHVESMGCRERRRQQNKTRRQTGRKEGDNRETDPLGPACPPKQRTGESPRSILSSEYIPTVHTEAGAHRASLCPLRPFPLLAPVFCCDPPTLATATTDTLSLLRGLVVCTTRTSWRTAI